MKRILILIIALFTIISAQVGQSIPDNSILSLTSVADGDVVIPSEHLREPGNPIFVGDDIILTYTIDKDNRQYVHYSYCNKDDLTNWTHMGRLGIYRDFFAKQLPHELEDPFLERRENDGKWILHAEDKYQTRVNNKFTIVQYNSGDWNYKTNTGFWDGGQTTIYPIDNGGVYSYTSFSDNGQHYYLIEERLTNVYKDISITYGGSRFVILPYNENWNIVVPDLVYKINGKFVMLGHGYYKSGVWASFIAQSETPLYHWRIISEPIEKTDIIPIYTDKWNYLYNSPEGLRLSGVKNDTLPDAVCEWTPDASTIKWLEEFIQTDGCGNVRKVLGTRNDFDLPDPIYGLGYNVVLMREARPLLFELKLDSIDTIKRNRVVDLIDEITGGDR